MSDDDVLRSLSVDQLVDLVNATERLKSAADRRYEQVEAERDRLRAVVEIARRVVDRRNPEQWSLNHDAFVDLGVALGQLDESANTGGDPDRYWKMLDDVPLRDLITEEEVERYRPTGDVGHQDAPPTAADVNRQAAYLGTVSGYQSDAGHQDEVTPMEETEIGRRVGGAIEHYRTAAKLSQRALGELLGVDQSMVSAYERGASLPPIPRVVAIEDALALRRGAIFVRAHLVDLQAFSGRQDERRDPTPDEVMDLPCHNCGATLEQCMRKPPCCRTSAGKKGCMHGGDLPDLSVDEMHERQTPEPDPLGRRLAELDEEVICLTCGARRKPGDDPGRWEREHQADRHG